MIAGAKRTVGTVASALGRLVEDEAAPAATRAAGRVSEAFRPPVRLEDGRFGYPLSPREPMRLPEEVHDAVEAGEIVVPEFDDALSESDDELLALADEPPGAEGEMPARDAAAGRVARAFSFNSRGMIERRDIEAVYRAESLSSVQQRDPLVHGFRTAEGADVAAPLMDGPALVTYDSIAGASAAAERQYGAGNFELYRIDSRSLRAVSERENREFNPEYVTEMQGRENVADQMSLQRIEELFGDRMTPAQLALRGDPRFEATAREVVRRELGIARDIGQVHIDNGHLSRDILMRNPPRITRLVDAA